jgi:hypothetical protein
MRVGIVLEGISAKGDLYSDKFRDRELPTSHGADRA